MEKIKQVLSSGNKKSVDETQQGQLSSPTDTTNRGLGGEGSHLAGTHGQQQDASVNHPIYDQFTGHSPTTASGEPTKTTGQPPHFSNTADIKQTPPNTADDSTPTSSLSPSTVRSTRPGVGATDEMSTASIKSGVMGFPQGGAREHAALDRGHDLDESQAIGPTPTNENDSSHTGRNAALGAGTVGGGALAAHELHRQRDNDNLRDSVEQSSAGPTHSGLQQSSEKDFAHAPTQGTEQPFERSFQEPQAVTDTDRSFPLAGGVTSRKQEEQSLPTRGRDSHAPLTSEREPGTKDKGVGVHDSQGQDHGREALAGAAAAATAGGAYSATYRHENEGERRQDRLDTTDRTAGLTETASTNVRTEREPKHEGHNKEALAGATAAVAAHSATSRPDRDAAHDHGGRGHTYSGDPCASNNQPSSTPMFTSGPHSTDTANRTDPRMHVPGEFPETPLETPGAGQSRELGAAGAALGHNTEQPAASSSGLQESSMFGTEPATATGPTTTEKTPSESQHHYGRDAALAGGAGAAGLGAYAAGRHHEREPTDIDGQGLSAETSPYSATKLDPRVDANRGGLEQQRFDPTARSEPSSGGPQGIESQHHGRNAGLASATGGAGLASYEASKHHGERSEKTGLTATQPESTRAAPQTQTQTEPREGEHHYGRNAALAGAGAATAGGLYYANQRDDKPDSGPASTTIGPHKSNAANVLDPRVQPDPALQKHHQAGPTQDDPATKTVGPHKSNVANIVDPRVQPEPEKQKGHTTTGPHQPDTLNRADPKVDSQAQPESQHHYGRDAALVGGAGAAGYGAHEAAKNYGEHRSTQPSASMNEQRYDPTAPGAHDPTAVGAQGNTTRTPTESTQDPQHHYGRDAAVAGGLGATGAGAYAASKHHGNESTQQPTAPQQHANVQGVRQEEQPSTRGIHDATQDKEHHYGRDAAVAGGLGAAGAGAYAANKHHGDESHHQAQVAPQQPHTSQPPLTQQQPTSQGTYDPNQSQHHYGRDAAAAGGLGAAGAGTYAASKHHDNETRQQPQTVPQQQYTSQAPLTQQQPTAQGTYDPNQTQHHYGRDAAVAGGLGAAGAGTYAATRHHDNEPRQQPQAAPQQQYTSQAPLTGQQPTARGTQDPNQSQHHYGRDAALAGGAGAGAGAYAASKHHDDGTRQPLSRENQDPAAPHQGFDSVHDQDSKNQKRNTAAAAGAAGVAGAGGAYAYSEHQAKEAEKERLAQQKAHEKELEAQRKQQQKDLEHKQKEQEKAFKEKEKEVEKQQAKEQKHHNKLVAAEDKAHHKEIEKEQERQQKEAEKERERQQKEAEKEERRHQKEAEKEEEKQEEGKEKKHHFFGFLHRDKKDKNKQSPTESAEGSPRQSRDYAAGGAGAAAYDAGQDSDQSEGRKGRNRLHKEPPKGHPAREALENQQDESGNREHMGIDGPIGRPDQISGDRETQSGVYGAHSLDNQKQTVGEPQSGLPTNTEQYGGGYSGNDGSNPIGGQGQTTTGGQQGGGANWEAIRKADTPY